MPFPKLSLSRVIALLSWTAGACVAASSIAGFIRPQLGIFLVSVAHAINAFTERLQGGASTKGTNSNESNQ